MGNALCGQSYKAALRGPILRAAIGAHYCPVRRTGHRFDEPGKEMT
jgi:hypothetical protein